MFIERAKAGFRIAERKGSGIPDPAGHFGRFGGRYVAETLMSALIELEKAYRDAWADRSFHRELDGLLENYAGRPTPCTSRSG